MIAIDDAQKTVLAQVRTLGAEDVPLLRVLGRIVAADIKASWDVPLTDNSTMDGYAFAHAALQGSVLNVKGLITAGELSTDAIAAGDAVRIMTGAPLPPGCDTVIPLEDVVVGDGTVAITRAVAAGANIRKRADDLHAGDTVIERGLLLRPAAIGVLASMGVATVAVVRQPTVAVIATGDELIALTEKPVPGKLINSNSSTLAAQIADLGGHPHDLGIAGDEPSQLRHKLEAALAADAIIISGGVSMGDRDHVKRVIEELGGEISFWKVNVKPGKPFAFATLQGKPLFALPGNPLSALICFELFVRPALLKMTGHGRLFRMQVQATTSEPLTNNGDRTQLVLVTARLQAGRYVVTPVPRQQSSRLTSMLTVNGYVKVSPGDVFPAGTEVVLNLLDTVPNEEGCHGV